MATKEVTLNREWQQLTERGTSGFIQIISGLAYICDSETQPDADYAAHPRGAGDMNFNDTVAWGRSTGEPVNLVISYNPTEI